MKTRNSTDATKLYHFTRECYLPSILNRGLDHGEVPLTGTESVNGISLTQQETRPFGGSYAALNKPLTWRLTVDLEPNDRLIRWRYLPAVIRMDRVLWKRLQGEPYLWWVYFGTIPPPGGPSA